MLGLNFKGSWRQYQKQVLDRFQDYQADGHVHLVAAPGSGKTTIGIELIARFGNPALILVPTVTIREQWVERIQTAFLENEQKISDLVSQNLKEMKALTIVTYQAFHSAMNQLQSQEDVFVAPCSESRVDTDGQQHADNETTATHRCNCHHSEDPLKA